MLNVRVLLVWCVLLAAAVANGAFRELAITPHLGDRAGRAVSSVILASLIVLIGRLLTPWLELRNVRDAWTTGVIWVVLTLAFEFLAGHFVFHAAWTKIVAEYDVVHGRIWVLVLVATLLAPVIGYTPADHR